MFDTLNSLAHGPSDADVLRLLDAACASALNIEPLLVENEVSVFTIDRKFLAKGDFYYIDAEGSTRQLPSYSTDPTAVRMLEEHAKKIGKDEEYVRELFKITNDGIPFGHDVSIDEITPLAFATPEQKARAFLKAVSHG